MTSSPNDAVSDLAKDSQNVINKMTDPSSSSASPTIAQKPSTMVEDDDDDVDVDNEDYFMEMNHNNFEEQCGFVLHIMIVLLSIYYTAWILSFYSYLIPIVNTGSTIVGNRLPVQPFLLLSSKHPPPPHTPPLWTIVAPITLIVLFFLIPIFYGACINRSAVVAKPHGHAQLLSILQDSHTIRPLYVSPLVVPHTSSPQINGTMLHRLEGGGHENDDYTKYYRNPMSWRQIRNAASIHDNHNKTTTTSIPDICDIDVADINDLLGVTYIIHEGTKT